MRPMQVADVVLDHAFMVGTSHLEAMAQPAGGRCVPMGGCISAWAHGVLNAAAGRHATAHLELTEALSWLLGSTAYSSHALCGRLHLC